MKVQHEGVEKLVGDYLMDLAYDKYNEKSSDNLNNIMVSFLFTKIPLPKLVSLIGKIPLIGRIPFIGKVLNVQKFIIDELDKKTPEVPLQLMEKLLDALNIPYTSGRRRAWPGGGE